MLTIWATCRPFRGEHAVAQGNAIGSWRLLTDDVILLGKEKGVARIAELLELRHIEEVRYNKWETPLLVSLFEKAREHARYDLLCSVCSDMILMDDLVRATEAVSSKLERFLMVGLKWHLDYVPQGMDFSEGWQERLRESARKRGKQHKKTGGSDYFVYPKGLFADVEFPKVLVRGRYRDDIWLITSTLKRGIPVVDATDVVMAVHQPHTRYPRDGPEVKANVRYTKHLRKKAVKDATWRLTKKGLMKNG